MCDSAAGLQFAGLSGRSVWCASCREALNVSGNDAGVQMRVGV